MPRLGTAHHETTRDTPLTPLTSNQNFNATNAANENQSLLPQSSQSPCQQNTNYTSSSSSSPTNNNTNNNNKDDFNEVEEFKNSASFSIHHPDHEIYQKGGGRMLSRFHDKLSHSPRFRRIMIIGIIVWIAIITPAVWLPLERIPCPATKSSSSNNNNTNASSSFLLPSSSPEISNQNQYHVSSFRFEVYDGTSAEADDDDTHNSSSHQQYNSLPFCKKSLDPDPLHWAAGVALLICFVCFIISLIFSELAEKNFCNYEKHAELCGVFPLTVIRTVMISCGIVAYCIEFIWIVSAFKRPNCPSGIPTACALYRASLASFIFEIVSVVYLTCFVICMSILSYPAEEPETVTQGIVKSVLEAGLPPEEEDRVEPGSPHFVAMQEEVFVEKCGCNNCCCGKDSGCGHCFASCLDGIKHSFEKWYNVDGRCGGCCSCLNTLCCCGDTNEASTNYTKIESSSNANTPIGFKAMKQHAVILAVARSIAPAVGYFTVISVLLLSYREGTPWSLTPPPDELFTCNDLFPPAQEIPSLQHQNEDNILFRLDFASNPEVLICTNMSDFDPEIKALPGILRTPNYISSYDWRCDYQDIQENCKGEDCATAFSSHPQPFGVFWRYVFTRQGTTLNSGCTYELTPRTEVSNCSGSNIIRVSGYGNSLLGLSFFLPPLFLAVFLRVAGPLVGGLFFVFNKYLIDSKEEFYSIFGKHKKHYSESFACDTPIINIFVAISDPVRFAETPDPPVYRMMIISVQVCEFFIGLFRVQPCWRWYQILYVSLQGVLLIKSMYDLYRDEIMVARWELLVEKRTKKIADEKKRVKK